MASLSRKLSPEKISSQERAENRSHPLHQTMRNLTVEMPKKYIRNLMERLLRPALKKTSLENTWSREMNRWTINEPVSSSRRGAAPSEPCEGLPVFKLLRGPFSAVSTPIFSNKCSFRRMDCFEIWKISQISAQFRQISREEVDYGKFHQMLLRFDKISHKFSIFL
jgi:hypothetical protein